MPSFKTVHRTVLKFTYAERLRHKNLSPSADGDKGAALDPQAFFYEKKAWRKNLLLFKQLGSSVKQLALDFFERAPYLAACGSDVSAAAELLAEL